MRLPLRTLILFPTSFFLSLSLTYAFKNTCGASLHIRGEKPWYYVKKVLHTCKMPRTGQCNSSPWKSWVRKTKINKREKKKQKERIAKLEWKSRNTWVAALFLIIVSACIFILYYLYDHWHIWAAT
jgi:hypothetical protein